MIKRILKIYAIILLLLAGAYYPDAAVGIPNPNNVIPHRGNAPLQSKDISVCVKYDDVSGSGKYPYNFRTVDDKLFAGGTLFNPVGHLNSEAKVLSYIKFLKGFGATSIITLNSLENSKEAQILDKLCKQENLIHYNCPMNKDLVPTQEQTKKIMTLIDKKAYIHCTWGADRTGAVVAKYLRLKKGYNGYEAWSAVISKGSHAGKIGGFKQSPHYKNLVLYFWPEVIKENKDVCRKYEIK